jgi:hypothetical protein
MQKSKKPEKIVEGEVMSWLNINGFSCDVIESKAVFSQKAKRYLRGQTTKGMSDIVGSDPIGRAVFIELKAKGKRTNISLEQYTFLMRKIDCYAFAVVVDNSTLLSLYYDKYCMFMKNYQHQEARNYLREVMPKYEV